MANTRQTYYISIGTGIAFKFSGTKTIYTTPVCTLLGISTTAPANAKIFSGSASTYGISKVRVKYVKTGTAGSDTAVYATGNVLVAPAKLEDALAGLAGQNYKGKDITEAYLARRRIFV
ncbi:MAG: hypothetical protein V7K40_30050 [Nostoc sp.]|uniref:hypothetical protein n=1 Tax=Nostoc sp. TaxID=1180 RepID=UPI002FFAC197